MKERGKVQPLEHDVTRAQPAQRPRVDRRQERIMTTSRKGRAATRRIIAEGQAGRAGERQMVIADLAIMLEQSARRPGYLPMRARYAVMRLQGTLGFADGEPAAGIEDRLAAALGLGEGEDHER